MSIVLHESLFLSFVTKSPKAENARSLSTEVGRIVFRELKSIVKLGISFPVAGYRSNSFCKHLKMSSEALLVVNVCALIAYSSLFSKEMFSGSTFSTSSISSHCVLAGGKVLNNLSIKGLAVFTKVFFVGILKKGSTLLS